MQFTDRREAGRLLAEQLRPLAEERPIIVALPRGGVPVGFEVAIALDAPLDILAVRKLGAPGNPEYGIGAIAEGGTAVLDAEVADRLGMTQEMLDETLARERRELRRRIVDYRGGRSPLEVRGRTVIIVDDGIATGLTDLAAVRALRDKGAQRIVVAVPVGARESIDRVAAEADEVVCHTIPHDLIGVGRWYDSFEPVPDDEVLALLAAAPAGSATSAPTAATTAQTPPSATHQAGADGAHGPQELALDLAGVHLTGDLTVPIATRGLVIFAHGSGSSRHSPRNRQVAERLNEAGFATLLFDLLTEEEGDRRELVFDIPLLARRLELVTLYMQHDQRTQTLPIGYFGASTGGGAALRAAAAVGDAVHAVVSRGGRPDLAADRLPYVNAPTLLLVGSLDTQVIELNRHAAAMLQGPHKLQLVAGAGHVFEEPGTLGIVAQLAADWFTTHLPPPQPLPATDD